MVSTKTTKAKTTTKATKPVKKDSAPAVDKHTHEMHEQLKKGDMHILPQKLSDKSEKVPELKSFISLPLQSKGRDEGMMALASTKENAFEENNIGYETPDDFQQAKMGKIILNLVTGMQNNKDREELIKIISDFEKKDVDCVVLACTDLQLLIPKIPSLKIFDTMKIFSDATVENIFE